MHGHLQHCRWEQASTCFATMGEEAKDTKTKPDYLDWAADQCEQGCISDCDCSLISSNSQQYKL